MGCRGESTWRRSPGGVREGSTATLVNRILKAPIGGSGRIGGEALERLGGQGVFSRLLLSRHGSLRIPAISKWSLSLIVNEQGTLDQQAGEKGPRITLSDTASVCVLAVRVLGLAD